MDEIITRAQLHEIYEKDLLERKALTIRKVFDHLCELVTGRAKEGSFTWSINLEDCIEQPLTAIFLFGIRKEYPDTYLYPRKRDAYFFREDILEKMKSKFPDCKIFLDGKIFHFDAS
jgi:hypothetical protein